jgi:hypothetical protein
MFIADAGIAIWVVGLFLVGLLGFFVMCVALVFRFLGWLLRALTGSGARNRRDNLPPSHGRNRLVCAHRGCGHANDPTAFFCGRCGRPLRRTYDVDAYG